MNIEKIKSSELVIIKKILAWQTAQVLGFENEETVKNHALLLAVDFDDDTFFPLMVGEYYSLFVKDCMIKSWYERSLRIVEKYIEKDHDNAMNFFGKDAAKKKWARRVEFDSFDFITIINDTPKWTHCVQHLFLRDGHLHSIYWFVEVEHYHQSQNAISFLAEHDALTGLYNRHKFNEYKNYIRNEKIKDEDIYYVFIDIDDFKNVNDSNGHPNGDKALITVSRRLEEVFYHKTHDIIFRLGGDEFLVIVTNTGEEELLERIKEANKPIDVELDDGRIIEIHTSIGYAHDIKKADKALYDAKGKGKNTYSKG
ncbi:MAG: GGDEF domain-containing protein [Gammaproteobacteria bacterium]|nr:GGDEF domain-containing protein [Gammaproteobacteria bacterium]